jgi:hypothetical protein
VACGNSRTIRILTACELAASTFPEDTDLEKSKSLASAARHCTASLCILVLPFRPELGMSPACQRASCSAPSSTESKNTTKTTKSGNHKPLGVPLLALQVLGRPQHARTLQRRGLVYVESMQCSTPKKVLAVIITYARRSGGEEFVSARHKSFRSGVASRHKVTTNQVASTTTAYQGRAFVHLSHSWQPWTSSIATRSYGQCNSISAATGAAAVDPTAGALMPTNSNTLALSGGRRHMSRRERGRHCHGAGRWW